MCDTCWTHWVDSRPWCESCVAVLLEPVAGLLYVAGVVFTAAIAWLVLRTFSLEFYVRLAVAGGVLLTSCIAAWQLHKRAGARRQSFTIQRRDSRSDEPPRGPPTGYRMGRAPLRVRRISPPVSGALTALIVGSCMALTAGTIPNLFELPRWLEFELVLALWWLVWATTFTVLLVRGWRVAQDVKTLRSRNATKSGSSSKWSSFNFADASSFDLEGCAVLIGILLFVGAAFLLAELIVPLLLVAAYWLIVRGLSAVANDAHECEGRIAVAVMWGSVWAAIYTVPLAALVWLVHSIHSFA